MPTQDRGQETDVTAQQAEPAVDVGGEGLHELIDDIQVIHMGGFLLEVERCRGDRRP